MEPGNALRTLGVRAVQIVWAPLAVVALHGFLALCFGHRTSLDPGFHFLGGVAGAYAVSQAIVRIPWNPLQAAVPYRGAVAVVVTVGAALVWEGIEFVSDRLLGTHVQMGPSDTLWDLGLGTAGAIAAAALLTRRIDQTPSGNGEIA